MQLQNINIQAAKNVTITLTLHYITRRVKKYKRHMMEV
jgi:hypothetical protein